MTDMLQIQTVTGIAGAELKAGDFVTFNRHVDKRSWWQRHAPRWLGGKAYSPVAVPWTGKITAVSGSDQ